MIPVELIYIAHLLSIWSLSPFRSPYLRIYVGLYISIIGICSSCGIRFPITFIRVFLKYIQAFGVVDMLNSRSLIDIIQHVAILYVSRGLELSPDLQHIPILCLGSVAPTYYLLGSIWPSVFIGRIYGLLLIICSLSIPLYTASTYAMSIYVFSVYTILCTYSVYSLGVYVNSHP